MYGLTILLADVAKHPKCNGCLILLEPEVNDKTLCSCGKYHKCTFRLRAHKNVEEISVDDEGNIILKVLTSVSAR